MKRNNKPTPEKRRYMMEVAKKSKEIELFKERIAKLVREKNSLKLNLRKSLHESNDFRERLKLSQLKHAELLKSTSEDENSKNNMFYKKALKSAKFEYEKLEMEFNEQIQNYKDIVETKDHEIINLENIITKISSENNVQNTLEEQIFLLQKENQKKELLIRQLKNRNDNLMKDLEHTKQTSESEIGGLKSELTNKERTNQRMKEISSSYDMQVNELSKRNRIYQGKIQRKDKDIAKLKGEKVELEKSMENILKRNEQLKKRMNEYGMKIAKTPKRKIEPIITKRRTPSPFRDDPESPKTPVLQKSNIFESGSEKHINRTLDFIENEFIERKGVLERKNMEISNMKKRIDELKEKLNLKEEAILKLKKESLESLNKLERTDNEKKTLGEKHNEDLEREKRVIEDLNRKYENMKKLKEDKETEIVALIKKHEDTVKKLSDEVDMEKKKSEVELQLKDDEKIEEMKKQTVRYQKIVKGLKMKNQNRKKVLEEMLRKFKSSVNGDKMNKEKVNENEEMRYFGDQLLGKFSFQKRELKALKEKSIPAMENKFKKSQEDHKKNINRYKDALRSQQTKIKNLRESAKQESDKKDRRINNLNLTIDSLKKSVEDKDSSMSDIKDSEDKRSKSIVDLKNDIKRLKNGLNEVKTSRKNLLTKNHKLGAIAKDEREKRIKLTKKLKENDVKLNAIGKGKSVAENKVKVRDELLEENKKRFDRFKRDQELEMKKVKDELKGKIEENFDSKNEISRIAEKLKLNNSEFQKLRENERKKDGIITRLREKYEKDIGSMNLHIQERVNTIQEIKKENEKFRKEVEDLKREKTKITKIFEDRDGERRKKMRELKNLAISRNNLLKEEKSKNFELLSAKGKSERIYRENDSELKLLRARSTKLDTDNKKRMTVIKQLKDIQRQKNKEIQDLRNNLNEVSEERVSIKGTSEKNNKILSKLRIEGKQKDEKILNLSKSLKEKKKRNNEFYEKVNKMEKENESITKDFEKLKRKSFEILNQKKNLEGEKSRLNKLYKVTGTKLQEELKKNRELYLKNEKCVNEISKLEENCDDYKDKMETAEKERELLRNEHEIVLVKLEKRENESKLSKEKVRSLSDQVKKRREFEETLKNEKTKLDSVLASKSIIIIEKSKQIEELQRLSKMISEQRQKEKEFSKMQLVREKLERKKERELDSNQKNLFETTINEKDSQISALKTKIGVQDENMNILENKKKDFEEKLEDSMKGKDLQHLKLLNQIKRLEKEKLDSINALNKEIFELKSSHQLLMNTKEMEIKKLNKIIREKENELLGVVRKNELLNSSLIQKSTHLDKVENKLNSAKRSAKSIEKLNKMQAAGLREKNMEIEELSDEVREKKEMIETFKKEIDNLMDTEIKILRKKVKKSNKDNDELKIAKEKVEMELLSKINEISDLKVDIGKKEKEIQELQQKLNEGNKLLLDHEKNLERIKTLEKICSEGEIERKELMNLMTIKTEQISEFEETNRKLKEEREEMRMNVVKRENEIKELNEKLLRYEEENQNLKIAMEEDGKKNLDFIKENLSLKKKEEMHLKEIRSLTSNINGLKNSEEIMNEKLNEVMQVNQSISEDNEALGNLNEEKENEVIKLQSALTVKEKLIEDEYRPRISSLNKSLNELKKQKSEEVKEMSEKHHKELSEKLSNIVDLKNKLSISERDLKESREGKKKEEMEFETFRAIIVKENIDLKKEKEELERMIKFNLFPEMEKLKYLVNLNDVKIQKMNELYDRKKSLFESESKRFEKEIEERQAEKEVLGDFIRKNITKFIENSFNSGSKAIVDHVESRFVNFNHRVNRISINLNLVKEYLSLSKEKNENLDTDVSRMKKSLMKERKKKMKLYSQYKELERLHYVMSNNQNEMKLFNNIDICRKSELIRKQEEQIEQFKIEIDEINSRNKDKFVVESEIQGSMKKEIFDLSEELKREKQLKRRKIRSLVIKMISLYRMREANNLLVNEVIPKLENQNSKLVKKLESLRKENKVITDTMKRFFEDEKKKFEEKSEERILRIMEQNDKERKSVELEYENLEASKKKLEKSYKDLNSSMNEVAQKLSKCEVINSQLEDRIKDMSEENLKNLNEIEEYRSEVDVLNGQIEEKNKEILEEKEKNLNLLKEMNMSKLNSSDETEKYKILLMDKEREFERSVAEAKDKVAAEYDLRINNLDFKINNLVSEKEELLEDLESSNLENTQLSESMEDMRAIVKKSKSKISNLKNQVLKHQNFLAIFKKKLSFFKTELEDIKKENLINVDFGFSDKKGIIDGIVNNIVGDKDQFEKNKEHIRELNEKIHELMKKNEKVLGNNESLSILNSGMSKKIGEYEYLLNERELNLIEKDKMIDGLKEEKSKLLFEIEDLKKSKVVEENKLKELKREINQKLGMLQEQMTKMERIKKQKESMELKRLKKNIKSIQDEYSETYKTLQDLKKRLIDRDRIIRERDAIIFDKDTRLKQLRIKLNEKIKIKENHVNFLEEQKINLIQDNYEDNMKEEINESIEVTNKNIGNLQIRSRSLTDLKSKLDDHIENIKEYVESKDKEVEEEIVIEDEGNVEKEIPKFNLEKGGESEKEYDTEETEEDDEIGDLIEEEKFLFQSKIRLLNDEIQSLKEENEDKLERMREEKIKFLEALKAKQLRRNRKTELKKEMERSVIITRCDEFMKMSEEKMVRTVHEILNTLQVRIEKLNQQIRKLKV